MCALRVQEGFIGCRRLGIARWVSDSWQVQQLRSMLVLAPSFSLHLGLSDEASRISRVGSSSLVRRYAPSA